jgi:hypothetical protein
MTRLLLLTMRNYFNLKHISYIDMRSSDKFATFKGIGQLAEKIVEMKNDISLDSFPPNILLKELFQNH